MFLYKAILAPVREEEIEELSMMAHYIAEEHIRSFYGKRQTEYMLEHYHSADAIRRDMAEGDKYFWLDSLPDEGDASFMGMLDVCGYLSCAVKGQDLVIKNIYIMEEIRGRHLIRECLDLLRKEVWAKDIGRMIIRIPEGYTQAIRVFEHLGFHKNGKEETAIGDRYSLNCLEYIREDL